jgi:hypothetical protein
MNKRNKRPMSKCRSVQHLLLAQGSAQSFFAQKLNDYGRKYGFTVFYKKELKFWFD